MRRTCSRHRPADRWLDAGRPLLLALIATAVAAGHAAATDGPSRLPPIASQATAASDEVDSDAFGDGEFSSVLDNATNVPVANNPRRWVSSASNTNDGSETAGVVRLAADEPATELQELRQRLAVLEQLAAESSLSSPSVVLPPDVASPAAAATTAATSDTNRWNPQLGGMAQLDYVMWPSADDAIAPAENYFSYRRLRLSAAGSGYEQFDFRLQLSLEPGQGAASSSHASPDIKDAYLSMNEIPGIGRLRFGNFFVPFGLEQVTNDTNNIFAERSIPGEPVLSPGREVGIAWYQSTEDQSITWAGGLFFDDINDTVKTRFSDRQGYRLSGRLTGIVYDGGADNRHLVHTGVSVLHTHDHDRLVDFRSRPHTHRTPVLIDSGTWDAGSYTTGNLELAVVWGSLTAQSELFLTGVDRPHAGTANIGGAYIHGSYFLTGESRQFVRFGQHGAQFGRSGPAVPFQRTGRNQGWGAVELKARWSQLNLSELDAGRYNDFTVGANWYWSDRTRWMLDWIHPITSSQTLYGKTESDLLALRLDFNW